MFNKLFKKKKNEDGINFVPPIKKNKDTIINVKTEIIQKNFIQEIPEFQGDYAKTIFLWANRIANPIKDNEYYQKYLIYECGIKNPNEYHNQLLSEGYFEDSTLEDKLTTKTAKDLKMLIDVFNLKQSTKKDDLIKTLLSGANHLKLEEYFDTNLYSLSEKGKDFLDNNLDYINIFNHKNWGISWKEYDEIKSKRKLKFNDILWGVFNERLIDLENLNMFDYLNMSELLDEEQKHELAYNMYLDGLYCFFSGHNQLQQFFKQEKRFEYPISDFTYNNLLDLLLIQFDLPPAHIKYIKKNSKYLDKDYITKMFEFKRFYYDVMSEKLFRKIIDDILNDKFDSMKTANFLKKLAVENYIEKQIS